MKQNIVQKLKYFPLQKEDVLYSEATLNIWCEPTEKPECWPGPLFDIFFNKYDPAA
jgi:hypothetical protein